MWFLFALISGAFYTAQGLLTRHVLRQNKDAWAFSFYFSAVGALVSLPFMLTHLKWAHTSFLWLLMISVGILVVTHNWLNFKSSNHLAASVQGSITKFRLIWVLLFGVLLLHESFNIQKLFGTILTIIAGWLIIKKFKVPHSFRGVSYALGATILYATVVAISKILLSEFSPQSLTFFIFFFPTIINALIMPRFLARVKKLFVEDGKQVIAACTLGGFANLAMNQAYAFGEISRVVVIIEAFLITTLVGEYVFLKEKDHLGIKISAVVLATLGAALIKLS